MSTDDNLGAVFGPAAAGVGTSGLAGRLPRRGRTPASAQPVAPPAAAPVAMPPAESVAQAVATPVAEPVTSEDAVKQISVYVLPHVPAAIRADKHGRTNAAVVYDAIEARQHRLTDLVTAHRATPGTIGGLFARTATDRRDDARVPWTFKVTLANRGVLDQLVTASGASSRSELVAAVLEDAYRIAPAPRPA